MCVCLQSVVTGTMTGERACRCECVLGDYYSLRDLGVDHQFVLVASRTLVVPNPNSSIQIMELMVGKTDSLQDGPCRWKLEEDTPIDDAQGDGHRGQRLVSSPLSVIPL